MLKKTAKRSFIILITLLQVGFFPRMSYAEGTASATTPAPVPTTSSTTAPGPATTTTAPDPTTTPPTTPPATQGPTTPPGAASKTYHFNADTGLWENDYYTWNPATGQTAPKTAPNYSYNPTTGKWDTTQWRYDAPSGQYVPNVVETPTPPAGAAISGGDASPQAASLAAPLSTDSTLTGPDSTNTATTSSQNAGAFNLFYNANISNAVDSTATSGNATVSQNTLGGNAGTGNATDMATVLNLLQSVWNPNSGPIATFTANVNGDVTGDLTIDPGPSSTNTANNSSDNKLAVNADQTTGINNNINLNAATGNASVTGNTSAGDATTGTATAVANVVNLLNSYITSGTSFVGTVNINGNLNGDILLPQDMLTQLLASNVPRTTINTSNIDNNSLLGQFNDTTNIKNNVNANAASGAADVSNNTTAGNATSGQAGTNVTILNLTGRDIIGSNAMLVFVNVLGKWIGMIMDAPGATSAVLGGGITTNTASNDATVNSTSNTGITNNINLNANSGDATVANNSKAGNATTGDATASANIANVSNSHLSLGGWFGVLFINVFGNWLGSFGVNTSAGDKPATPPPAQQPDVKVFKFTPTASAEDTSEPTYHLAAVPTTGSLGTGSTTNTTPGQVLGASTVKPVYPDVSTGGLNPIAKAYIILAFAGLFIMSGGKLIAFLRGKKTVA